MRKDAADLRKKNADVLRAFRHFNAEEFFRREAERMLLVHRRDIIEAVEIRDRLQIRFILDQLFGAAMKEADMRIDALDDFAVKLEHKTQNAVRRRVLRPEIDGEITRARRFRGRFFR
ncbi:MAG: hypothetical protein R3C58_01295 [Parvularculaceae bacterium]